jgi:hypothetical protein
LTFNGIKMALAKKNIPILLIAFEISVFGTEKFI